MVLALNQAAPQLPEFPDKDFPPLAHLFDFDAVLPALGAHLFNVLLVVLELLQQYLVHLHIVLQLHSLADVPVYRAQQALDRGGRLFDLALYEGDATFFLQAFV